MELAWNYATNITDYNSNLKTTGSLAITAFQNKMRERASKFDVSKLSADTKRQIKFITSSAIPKDKAVLRRMTELISKMEGIYSTGKVEDNDSNKLALEPDLWNIMATIRDYDRLQFAWKGWRDAFGPTLRPLYKEFVKLKNQGARDNGWKDIGEYWRSFYEVEDFEGMVEGFWTKLKPLFQELHAYVRYRLSQKYSKMKKKGPIPAHLLGDMWAMTWENIYDLVEPYKGKPSLDVTANMVKQNYTALKMVQLAESFFTSIGLQAFPKSFYNKSLFTKPEDGRAVVCHASAWDFLINKDVRIKQCTTIDQSYLIVTHHELGHVQYFLQYWDLPFEYREGANPGFHEAVGDTLSLSVDTPQHLTKIGLLEEYSDDKESDINALMKMALMKVAFLPYGFLIDQWRWKVFSGAITEENYNAEWWKLRTKYHGVRPPVDRSENDFDPGCKYHIPANYPYIRYFMSFILQFQFHKAACKEAGHKGPLHTCSIYKFTKAGKKIGDMLKMGRSKPWPQALEKLTGSQEVDVGAITEYFQPLRDWLVRQREKIGYEAPGWEEDE